ncbi:hypothetical protein BGZ99_003159 [Dissophora globulifera]|uniref:Uncharacterized protein n=1 Tax=Dissophora globulifera TaxID=979702 RepID=A0A9P6UVJ8_9FUNG|nr:hypothetical protein BGZ99_003159 [Dissophora globulifera]
MAVFGSISYKDETKLWRLDFNGVFRLMQFDAFLVPLTKQEFGVKARAAVTKCLELALRVRKDDYAQSEDAASVIDITAASAIDITVASAIDITPASIPKNRAKIRWSEVHVFWEPEVAKTFAKKSACKSAGNLVEGSQPFAKTLIAENAKEQEQRQRSSVPSITPLTSDKASTIHSPKADKCARDDLEEEMRIGFTVRDEHRWREFRHSKRKKERNAWNKHEWRDFLRTCKGTDLCSELSMVEIGQPGNIDGLTDDGKYRLSACIYPPQGLSFAKKLLDDFKTSTLFQGTDLENCRKGIEMLRGLMVETAEKMRPRLPK